MGKKVTKKAEPKKLAKKIEKFADIKDPKTEHKKAIAKAKTFNKTSKLLSPSIVGLSDDGKKILKYGVTATGVYSSYLGSVKKLGPKGFEALKKKYEKKGEWSERHQIDEKIEELKKGIDSDAPVKAQPVDEVDPDIMDGDPDDSDIIDDLDEDEA